MSLAVIFSPNATKTLLSIASFIESKWSKKTADKFLQKTYKTIDVVAKQPYMFKASIMQNNIRHGMINKHSSFLYQVHTNHIAILYFWDNRQEPLF